MKTVTVVAVAALVLAGCATYRPIVDLHDSRERQYYERDLADCQAYARQVDPAGRAVAGAFIGALIGAAFGAAVGDHHVAADVARIGAVEGAVAGGVDGAQTQVDVIRMCLADRGYHVLN